MILKLYLMQALSALLFCITVSAQALYNVPCPLLDLNYPVPSTYATASAIQNATRSLQDSINRALNATTSYGQLGSESNAFSVDIYSINDQNSLFTYHFTPNSLQSVHTVGVQSVDSDTVYRIGSVSKMYTMYLYLMAAGDATWNQPVTKFVPELAAYAQKNRALQAQNAIDYVDWESITIADLASHLAGIPRDAVYSLQLEAAIQTLGAPPLTQNASNCGNGQGIELPCTRSAFFDQYLRQHPIVAPAATPIYSNAAFQILGYALENITGKSMPQLFQDDFVQPLGLASTYYTTPTNQNTSFIPINASVSYWDTDLRGETPAGGYYSTINDMRKIGKSILNSTYLSQAQTRRWLKPRAFTANPNFTVGAPWEIFRAPGSPVQWFYSKTGNIGAYGAFVVFLPEYDIGMTFLGAGSDPFDTVRVLADMTAEIFTPALLAASRADAVSRYAGTYADPTTNSSMTIAATENGTGLVITGWSNNGTQVLTSLSALLGVNQTVQNLFVILYPSGLTSGDGSKASWRASFDVLPHPADPGAFSGDCVTWARTNTFLYGGVGLDEFVFTLDNNGATSVQSRVLGVDLAHNRNLNKFRLMRVARHA